MKPERDDDVDAARRRVVRQQFSGIVDGDPLLKRLAVVTRFPRVPLRSTVVLGLAALVLAFLRDNLVVAVLVALTLVVGQGIVVHLLANDDEPSALVVVRVLRGACGLAVFLLVAAAVTTPSGAGVTQPPATRSGVPGQVGPSSSADAGSGVGGQSSGQGAGAPSAGAADGQAGSVVGQGAPAGPGSGAGRAAGIRAAAQR